MTSATPSQQHETSIKETLISLLISFAMAMVFRSYVVEAFIIPTGSMAPTLLGAHMEFESAESGYRWAVNPWYMADQETPFGVQGQGQHGLPSVTDPMSTNALNTFTDRGRSSSARGYLTPPESKPLRAGDRILVHKYLYALFEPQRFDVVVFKNPELATQNFIKRLIGLPNEQVWLAAGDVFTRTYAKDAEGREQLGPWQIQRKPARTQESVWRPVYSSQYAPLNPTRNMSTWFVTPWTGAEWETENRREYRTQSAGPTTLAWDSGSWPVTSWEPYNEYPARIATGRSFERYPVTDLRVRAGIRPDAAGMSVAATIVAQRHEYQGAIEGGRAVLRMRPQAGEGQEPGAWTELASAPADAIEPGRVTNVAFWHADQALGLSINEETVVRATYDWDPLTRLTNATVLSREEIESLSSREATLASAARYAPSAPRIEWSFSGSAATLYRVELDRDLYYEPTAFFNGRPGLATNPRALATLGPDQFFVLGDNSASSKDGRLWDTIDPWVADQMGSPMGVVPRDLMLGKAFFVYFPATEQAFGRIPVPAFGRMRFIR